MLLFGILMYLHACRPILDRASSRTKLPSETARAVRRVVCSARHSANHDVSKCYHVVTRFVCQRYANLSYPPA